MKLYFNRRQRRQIQGLSKSVPSSTKISKHTRAARLGTTWEFRKNRFAITLKYLVKYAGKLSVMTYDELKEFKNSLSVLDREHIKIVSTI